MKHLGIVIILVITNIVTADSINMSIGTGENHVAMLNAGKGKKIEFEATLLIYPFDIPDVMLSGNILLNQSTNAKINPFITLGFGTCTHIVPWINYGLGLKYRLPPKKSLRLEYHEWGCYDFRGGFVLLGLSFH